MQLKDALAGAFRTIRAMRGLDYDDLSEVSAKAKISALERGKAYLSLDQLDELATALQVELPTLLTLCLSIMKGESTDATIARISTQLEAFRADGGFELLASQFADDELVQRPRGKPQNTKNKTDVLTLKIAGLSQAEVAEKLGLPTSTVNDYWKLK